MNFRTPFEVFQSFGVAVMVFGVTTETQPVFKPPDTLIPGAGEPADLGNAARYCPVLFLAKGLQNALQILTDW